MGVKEELDKYKDNKMHHALLSNEPKIRALFIEYAMNDATILTHLLDRFRESLEEICLGSLNFPTERVPKQWPNTLGACVARILET